MVYRRYFHDIDYKVGMNAIKRKYQVKKSDFSFLKDKRKFLGALAYKDKNDNWPQEFSAKSVHPHLLKRYENKKNMFGIRRIKKTDKIF